MLIGGHVSVAGGLTNAINRAEKEGFPIIQIFVTSPRSFNITHYFDEDIGLFRKIAKEKNIKMIFLHAIYLVNIATENKRLYDLSIESLIHYMRIGDKIGAEGTIVHLGSDKAFDQVVDGIKFVLGNTPRSQKLIIENAASAKKLPSTIDECLALYRTIDDERLHFCIDTQHLFASGVNICNEREIYEWFKKFDQMIGLRKLSCIHCNDSKTDCGSSNDRHENIGEGKIGQKGLKSFFAYNGVKDIPIILETPGFDGKGPDRENRIRLENVLK